MRYMLIGEYIKSRRLDMELKQEDVFEGICSAATFSRLENNKQTPGRSTINALLNRLDLPDDRFFALLSEQELRIDVLRKSIRGDQILFKKATAENRPAIRERALQKLAELEQIMDKDDAVTLQYIRSTKITLGKPEGPYCFQERLDLLMEAIRLTIPRFDLDKIDQFRYSLEEMAILNKIALTYSREGKLKEAVSIYSQLLMYIEKNDVELPNNLNHFCLISHNYAIALAKGQQYKQAIEVAERGQQMGIMYGDYLQLPGFLAIQAECYFFLGEKEKSACLYFQACYLYKAINDEHEFRHIQQEMYEHLGLKLPDYAV